MDRDPFRSVIKMRNVLFFSLSVFALPLSAFEPAKAKVIASSLKVRDLPSIGGDVIATLKRGEIVEAIEESKQTVYIDDQSAKWYKVKLSKKKTGWVFGGYISFELNLELGLRWQQTTPSQSESFSGVAIAPDGIVYAGTRSGNIYISQSQSRWKKITPQALGLSIGPITRLLIAGNTIYATSADAKRGGVWKTRDKGASWTQYTSAQGLPSNEVYDIRQRGNELWVATGKGVAYSSLSADTWVGIGGETPAPCVSVAFSEKGLLYAGTRDGLYKLSSSTGVFNSGTLSWDRIGKDVKNMGPVVYSLAIEGNLLLIGTNKGLVIGDAGAETLNPFGGETSVTHIATDDNGRIFVATLHGLNISSDSGKSWVTYKDEHGIRGNAVSQISTSKNKKNQIWVSLDYSGLAYSE